MISSEQISIVYYILLIIGLIVSYLNRIKLKKIGERLINKIKQLRVFVKELPRLWDIIIENSQNYESMIEFRPVDGVIMAESSVLSPYLQFGFSISNYSIFDFEINRIAMDVCCDELGRDQVLKKITTEDLEWTSMQVPRQKHTENRAKLQPLPTNFVAMLKELKASKKRSIKIELKNINIDFRGNKDFRKSWTYNTGFELEIPMSRVNVDL